MDPMTRRKTMMMLAASDGGGGKGILPVEWENSKLKFDETQAEAIKGGQMFSCTVDGVVLIAYVFKFPYSASYQSVGEVLLAYGGNLYRGFLVFDSETTAYFNAALGGASPANPSSLRVITLPDVSNSDNGKVLGVVGGAWEKMDAPSGGSWMSFTEDSTDPHQAVTMTTDEAKRIVQNGEPFMIYDGSLVNFLCVHGKLATQTVGTYTKLNCVLYGRNISGDVELRKGSFVVESGWESGYFENFDEITGYGVDNTLRCLMVPSLPDDAAQDTDGFYLRYDAITKNFEWVQKTAIYILTLSNTSINLVESAMNATVLALLSGQSTEYAYHDVTTDPDSIVEISEDVFAAVYRGLIGGKVPYVSYGSSVFAIKGGELDPYGNTYGAINVSGMFIHKSNGVAVAEIDVNVVLAYDSSGASITTNGKLLWKASI